MEPVEPVQMNIYESNTYRKNLSWLHFKDEARVQELQQVNDQQSCMFVFVAYPTNPSSNLRRKATSGERNYRTNQGPNFLGGNFSNRYHVRAPIQFRTESQPEHLKG